MAITPGTGGCELSIVMPCLDEAETLAACILKAQRFLAGGATSGEVVVVDNGSTDGSRDIALALGARVVDAPRRGYGAALKAGIEAAHGRWVVMGDADDTYDFAALAPFLERLAGGADLVMGNRFRGGIAPGAMPPLHRHLGTPALSALAWALAGTPCGDIQCGLRGLRRDAFRGLRVRADGMAFASEMVVVAALNGLRIEEVPTTLAPCRRSRPPHLRTWRDGWSNLRSMVGLCPRRSLVAPGGAAVALGLVAGLAAFAGLGAGTGASGWLAWGGAAAVSGGATAMALGGVADLALQGAGVVPGARRPGLLGRPHAFEGLVGAGVLALLAGGLALAASATHPAWGAALLACGGGAVATAIAAEAIGRVAASADRAPAGARASGDDRAVAGRP